jgi:hypothetical protein
MTTRTTISDCEKTLAALGSAGKFPVVTRNGKSGWAPVHKAYFFIGVAYGRPRVHYSYKNGGIADISPRLPTGKLREWMKDFGVAGFKDFLKYKMRD